MENIFKFCSLWSFGDFMLFFLEILSPLKHISFPRSAYDAYQTSDPSKVSRIRLVIGTIISS